MTHVFIVDDKTFGYHLRYMFAGTGAGEKISPFLKNASYKNASKKSEGVTAATERDLISMIADISKVKIGDKIIFYLQMTNKHQGMFFGIFEATTSAFFDEAAKGNFLFEKTKKYLTYRILIKPVSVFPQGITEHEFLDSLKGKSNPYDLCWSLIYRKLRGKRGCTTIFDYEAAELFNKLKTKNQNKTINYKAYTFDPTKCAIKSASNVGVYKGKKDAISISDRLKEKSKNRNSFEVHLQAFIIQNIENEAIKNLIIPDKESSYWLGNEVNCGVGMQRIDLLIIQEKHQEVLIKVIELKYVKADKKIITEQLQWYIEWVQDYVLPHFISKTVKLIPCVIANGAPSDEFKNIALNAKFAVDCEPVEYIGFDIKTQSLQKHF